MICDLHIHSKYSRATSRECTPECLEYWARRKGIGMLGTGDFTHPAWRAQLKEMLEPTGAGVYRLKKKFQMENHTAGAADAPHFVISGEISSIYKKNGRTRKVHNLILLPSLEAAEKLSSRLETIGNIHSDGRPILGLDSRDLMEITMETCAEAIFIPAHIWTPHFSMFGAFSGFDTVEECFEDMTPYIHAVETGLSSDPPMNWRLSALDRFALVSNSDAHSPSKLGREANLIDIEPEYGQLKTALSSRGAPGFRGTVEFFPEEGKYHLDGHRACEVRLTPEETRAYQGKCPKCGKKITVGVFSRAAELADRPEGYVPEHAPGFEHLVPLAEIIAASTGYGAASGKVTKQYDAMLETLGPEFEILRRVELEQIEKTAGPCIAEGIRRVRAGEVKLLAGYDGEYGVIEVLSPEEIRQFSGQMSFLTSMRVKKAATKKKKTEITAETEEKAAPKSQEKNVLNPEQAQAASAEGVVAVLAGPGTGKTQTLVARIEQMVERGVNPASITAVTFTNKAAGEMRQRMEKRLGKQAADAMTIGTFHAICLQQLRQRRGKIFLADETAALAVAASVAEEWEEKISPAAIVQGVSRKKNQLDSDFPEKLVEGYQKKMQACGLVDFDDLLLEGMAIAEEADMGHILVDEFQDMNPVQYQLMQKWSTHAQSLFVIGDPDQAIYGFRGSDPLVFDRFFAEYPHAQKIRLKENYRSTPEVLECALLSIAANKKERDARRLIPHRESGEHVRSIRAGDELAQGIWIAKEINKMTGGLDMLDAQTADRERTGLTRSFSDIAVLYRTHRQAQMLERCLKQEGIPYVVVGRDAMAEDKTVQGTIAFFRQLLRPEDRSSLVICLRQVMGVRKRDAEAYAAGKIVDITDQPGIGRWLQLRGIYQGRAETEKPAQLLQDWMKDIQAETVLEPLVNMAVFYDTMGAFLDTLTLGSEGDILRNAKGDYHSEAVMLTTMHGSKGLEFPAVFLCGANDGLVPMNMPGRVGDIEEERRLFYVGLTRAKDELIITGWGKASPFLKDLSNVVRIEERKTKQAWGRQLSFL